MHPDTELGFVSKSIGCGVFATKFIPKGTITWILDDLEQKFDEAYLFSLKPVQKKTFLKYTYRNHQGKYILSWDIAKFVNHSFNSNCMGTAYEFEIAIRDIYPGEELTDDYGYLNLDEPFDCIPEPGSSRIKVMPDDILHFYQDWDQKASEAMKYFNSVDQPLESLINKEFIEKVNEVASGKKPIDSILACYYDCSRIKVVT